MRVKVLYTFDDRNTTNCLARLPNPLSIPVLPLDETTEVGIIELKSCIQAIVAASPELVARLGHDFTVYAYDYSEYETPLVGQGLLSWILAAASATPHAPAQQSETKVTGRVCKNILGLFSNGIKETLEVKLKLVPVPSTMQKEYVESMERYRSPTKMFSDAPEYAWPEFLRANPAIHQLAHPTPSQTMPWDHRSPPEQSAPPPVSRVGDYKDQQRLVHSAQPTRASSPAMSTASFGCFSLNPESRPASRESFHEQADSYMERRQSFTGQARNQNEEGSSKKRARVTKANRPRKTALATNNDSLRVTASTAASVRLHRPVAMNPAMAAASAEQFPRAPTPRPGGVASFKGRETVRPQPSLLRHASVDGGRSFMSPYDSSAFSDHAIESADDGGPSPGETALEIPSSPPVMPQPIASPAPSSPGLPTLPYPHDSGFVSDLGVGRDFQDTKAANKLWDGTDQTSRVDVRPRARQDRSHHPWKEYTPRLVDNPPNSNTSQTSYGDPRQARSGMEALQATALDAPASRYSGLGLPQPDSNTAHRPNSLEDKVRSLNANSEVTRQTDHPSQSFVHRRPSEQTDSSQATATWQVDQSISAPSTHTIDLTGTPLADGNLDRRAEISRATTPNAVPKQLLSSKPKGLSRSQTWSGGPMSDAIVPAEEYGRNPRSGSGAKRKQGITEKMQAAIDAGKMPTYCGNCGEIETPTWRKAYHRVEDGTPEDIVFSNDGIIGLDIINPKENVEGLAPQYRIYKQATQASEEKQGSFEVVTLCNPCGLWLYKKHTMRPREVWDNKKNAADNQDKLKRKRNPTKGSRKKVKAGDQDDLSDVGVPHSEPLMPGIRAAHISSDLDSQSAAPSGISSSQFGGDGANDRSAATALRRAIQSSPGGFRGSRDSPVDLEPDLTPKPTRRLLFPSPRKDGETKSLDGLSVSPTSMPVERKTAESPVRLPDPDDLDVDKENFPPDNIGVDDDLAHLFEDDLSPKTTPTKSQPLQDLLKTPTPTSRQRAVPTPQDGSNRGAEPFPALLMTPSRNMLTPKQGGKAATVAPETPFTAQMNAFFSDCMQSSPSHGMHFPELPPLDTPGRQADAELSAHFFPDDFLSSDLPMPSSSPDRGLGFAVFEDPTSTVGIWSGASIFEGNDAIFSDDAFQANSHQNGGDTKTNDISTDFAAMIDKAVGATQPVDAESQDESTAEGSMTTVAEAT
ncbi:hypothetical protein EJ04DRAFT_482909 [Polyplosphaeria fusca]|uniref:Ams2/SPT21 N-terminal domain-containing protein n=1 Tax=Polyplosphaeria fusca TaxID=682080 RepID=A0A9P4RAZ5_9PLEO|nr:hypothetical protein EJ04DRAFT_482909 [Polyplosphaeria fusca]